jgi:hypothetical protein
MVDLFEQWLDRRQHGPSVDHRELAGFVFGRDSHGPGNMAQQIERSKQKGLILDSEAVLVIQDRIDWKAGKKSKIYLLRRNAALECGFDCGYTVRLAAERRTACYPADPQDGRCIRAVVGP